VYEILSVQGLREYFLVSEVLELYYGRECKKALLLDPEIKTAKYGKSVLKADAGCCNVLLS
jgi:hypothetical protein